MRNLISVSLFLSTALCLQGQPNSGGGKSPVFLRQAIRDGEKGDVFDKLKANDRARFLHIPPPFPMDESALKVLMTTKAEEKDPRALAYLGLIGLADYGNPKDREHAKGLIKQAAELGHTKAQLTWANLVWMDHKDAREAAYWWNNAYQAIERKAQQGDLDSMFEMGNYAPPPGNSDGSTRAFSQETTRSYLIKAAENGHVEAASMLGHILEVNGRTVEDQREAWKWLTQAAQAGDVHSMVALARHYARPDKKRTQFTFINYDPTKAWEWLDKAIALNADEEVGEFVASYTERGWLPPRPKTMPSQPKAPPTAVK